MKNSFYLVVTSSMLTLAACSPEMEKKVADSIVLNQPHEQFLAGKNEQRLMLESKKIPAMADEPVAAIRGKQLFPAKLERKSPLQGAMQESSKAVVSGSQTYDMAAPVSGLAILPSAIRQSSEPVNRENYHHYEDNGIKLVSEQPVSTFSIDVDTGSYSNARRMINNGQLPPKDAVRSEEFLNYFSYDELSLKSDMPFAVYSEVGPSPWNSKTHLMRVSLKAAPLTLTETASNNLVFLVDVSGSMRSADKLGLLKKSLKLLSRQLDADDSVSIVVYAGASGLVLEPVAGNDWLQIEQALSKLEAGGSTNGGAGIELAYQTAKQAFIKGGNNRVILATDGDFNVGTVNQQSLIDMIERQRKQGVFLTTLGFGTGNYNDHLMEQLADHGNGNYAYIDSLMEARKVLVDEIGATLQTVASDVKIQIEFNPRQVSEYRLIGYENRHLAREDFNNDSIDAGEIGAGHSVMALYEVSFTQQAGMIDPLRYQSNKSQTALASPREMQSGSEKRHHDNELAFVKLRYKPVNQQQSVLNTFPIKQQDVESRLDSTSTNYRFASAVAAFAQKLRGGKYLGDFNYRDIHQLAEQSRGDDKLGLRSNFLQLVGLTESLDPQQFNTARQHDRNNAMKTSAL